MGQTLIPKFIANTLRALRSIAPLRAILIGLSLLLAFLSISPVSAATSVSGTISSNTTWAVADSPFQVTGDVTVASGVTLTIDPGVTVKFDSGKVMEVDGTLVARGTSTSTITFTSSAASPAAGDWGYIKFSDTSADASFDGGSNYDSGSVLQHCIVEYGGGIGGDNLVGAVWSSSAAPFIDNCTIRQSLARGVLLNHETGLRFTNNTLDSNVRGALGGSGTITGVATVVISGNTITDSGYDPSHSANWAPIHVSYDGSGVIVSITDNTISESSSYDGGGISAAISNSGVLTVSNNQVINNSGIGAIVLFARFSGAATASGNLVKGNSGSGFRASTLDDGVVTISGNRIIDNNFSVGGGIHAGEEGGTITITDNCRWSAKMGRI